MNVLSIKTLSNFQNLTKEHAAVIFYLSTPECNVCKVLKPKVIEMLKNDFRQIHFYYIDLNEAKEISGQLSVLSVPTILVYFEGKEMIRVSRIIHLKELRE
jgi:thioredoxin-like negative regulator of GroEL